MLVDMGMGQACSWTDGGPPWVFFPLAINEWPMIANQLSIIAIRSSASSTFSMREIPGAGTLFATLFSVSTRRQKCTNWAGGEQRNGFSKRLRSERRRSSCMRPGPTGAVLASLRLQSASFVVRIQERGVHFHSDKTYWMGTVQWSSDAGGKDSFACTFQVLRPVLCIQRQWPKCSFSAPNARPLQRIR